ncbi:MAG: phenylalanine 4-monooxygenase, partial [Bdellovibrionales bacterium]|nr:phenylalanine 4-monooxygenase [Bdellovibrionales bacterium]
MKELLPTHLQKYVVDQNYQTYTWEDHSVWRYIIRQLKNFMKDNAHSAYVEGLQKTGLEGEMIPKIEVINEHLNKFGWSAVAISGFIPPAAFMEFQSLGYLPVATDIRTIDHIHYTPAPDIVHESAGHAPILIDPKFSNYLKSYAQVAKKAIFSKQDLELYEAIRTLSDLKENPNSTKEEIKDTEEKLHHISNNMKYIS